MSKQKHDTGFKKRLKAEAERARRMAAEARKSHWGVPRGGNSGKPKASTR